MKMNETQTNEITETRQPRPEEKKKGLMRMFELLDRDGGKFFKSGVLVFVSAIPFAVAVLAAVVTGSPLLLLACIPCGMLAAPQICGAADTVMRSQRDEVGWWWWDTYKKAWKRNAKAALLPGAVFGFLAGAQIWSLYLVAVMENPIRDFWFLAAAMLLELSILSYYLPMLVCMELPFPALLRNCFVLFFSHPVKSLLAGLLQLVYYILILVWFPLTSVIFFATSVWLPMLMSCVVLYPALDKHFGLTAAYEKIQQEQWGANE